ncbi:MAG: hypothetical protein ABIQ74_07315 [Chitinophagales bacterium]
MTKPSFFFSTDHADEHRLCCRRNGERKFTDHTTMYSTSSVLNIMELILNLPRVSNMMLPPRFYGGALRAIRVSHPKVGNTDD